MVICRYYLMIAKEAEADALGEALVALGGQVRAVEGCEGVELFRDSRDPTRFHFIERWTSIDAHKAAGQQLGKEAFAPVMAAVAEPPVGAYLDLIALG